MRYFYEFLDGHYWVCDRTRHSADREGGFDDRRTVARCHYVDDADRLTALLNADDRVREQARMRRKETT